VNKRMTAAEVAGRIDSGMTIGIGGWGSRRKPMDLVRALLNTDVDNLTVVSFGGPDVGLLCAAGKVKKVVYGFVSLDRIPLEPWFRHARQTGQVEALELDEGMVQWGLLAACHRLPFLPTRAGLGSDVMRLAPELKTIESPYDDGETLVAMPALKLDAALIHMNRADERGNGQCLGPDPFFDDLFAGAAEATYMSCERIVSTAELTAEHDVRTLVISRMHVAGVVEAPGGARFTSCPPDYDHNNTLMDAYGKTGGDHEALAALLEAWE
jgi:glutaconate CoA-transferase subunit A